MEHELAMGVADLLHQSGIGVIRSGGAYLATDVALFYRVLPDSPGTAISLSPYTISDDSSLSSSLIGLQVRTRGGTPDPRQADKLAEQVFDEIQGLHRQILSTGVMLVLARRASSASLGQDSARRWTRSDNYYCDVHYPSKNRI